MDEDNVGKIADLEAFVRELVKDKGWGPARDEAQEKSRTAEANGQDFWSLILVLLMSWLERTHPGGLPCRPRRDRTMTVDEHPTAYTRAEAGRPLCTLGLRDKVHYRTLDGLTERELRGTVSQLKRDLALVERMRKAGSGGK